MGLIFWLNANYKYVPEHVNVSKEKMQFLHLIYEMIDKKEKDEYDQKASTDNSKLIVNSREKSKRLLKRRKTNLKISQKY